MIPSVSQQPSVNFSVWHTVKILGDYHLVGEPVNREDGGARITSPIAEIDVEKGWAKTASGRQYRLFEGSIVPFSQLKRRYLRGYCVRHGLKLEDVELTDFQEVELALAVPVNRLIG